MATTTLGVKLDDATRERLKEAAQQIAQPPHWMINQAIFNYLEQIDGGLTPPWPLLQAKSSPRIWMKTPCR